MLLCVVRPLPLLLLLALLLVLPSCADAPLADETGQWAERVLENPPPRRDVLDACEWALVQAGFPPGDRDDGRSTVTSGWDILLQPFRNKGRRWQGLLHVESQEDGSMLVKARVLQQRNLTQDDTLDSGAAQWEAMADDMPRARILLQHLLVQLHLDES